MLREQIKQDLIRVAQKLGVTVTNVEVVRSTEPKFGDYSTNLPIKISRLHQFANKQSPLEIAKILADNLKDLPYLEKLEVAGPGFINFFIKIEVWQKEVEELLKKKDLELNLKNKKILVEFAHPNTHKLFHIGHLRNIVTGEAICRLLEAVGNQVWRANYQGDIGLHIAKALWGISKLKLSKPKTLADKIDFLSKAYVLGNRAYEEKAQAKKEIEETNRCLYEGNAQLVKLWQETKNWSLKYFDRIYARVGTKFDRLYFESEVAESGKKEVLKFLKKGVFVKSQGAVIFPGEKFALHNRVFITKAGLATYEAKDVGLAKLQFRQYSPNLVIHVVGPEQKGYFEVLFKALEQIYPETKGKELHLIYGWVRLKSGKMSSRKGEVVTADWLLAEAKKKALAILEESLVTKDNVDKGAVTGNVGVGAVKYSILKMSLAQDLVFDLAESVTLNGNSGPYLQYTYARCQSVLVKATNAKTGWHFENLTAKEELLLKTLGHFQETIADSAQNLAPNLLANFLYEVAQKYNTFYDSLPILRAGAKERSRRLFLTKAVGQVLKRGLDLLGIEAPERM